VAKKGSKGAILIHNCAFYLSFRCQFKTV